MCPSLFFPLRYPVSLYQLSTTNIQGAGCPFLFGNPLEVLRHVPNCQAWLYSWPSFCHTFGVSPGRAEPIPSMVFAPEPPSHPPSLVSRSLACSLQVKYSRKNGWLGATPKRKSGYATARWRLCGGCTPARFHSGNPGPWLIWGRWRPQVCFAGRKPTFVMGTSTTWPLR